MKKYLITSLMLILINPLCASAKGSDITGNYFCKGYDPFEKAAYAGTLNIKKTGDTYAFSSDYGKNGKYNGTGMYEPALNLIVAAFTNPDLADESGVSMMFVQKDGSLKGKWTYLQKTTFAPGECKKM